MVVVPAFTIFGGSSADNRAETPDPDPDPSGGADCIANGTVASIGSNHGHTLTLTTADVAVAVDKT